ncbi:hypothetical protein [Rubinisphaera margarita]|uniref:hypothetical protein n=1 Tax=Rubinisphaera margarita TaxID=2909586 RepID=UPI001EE9002F|nr:hypothetical protein [Rubinisphaera margarita]MCG6157134.1 hypothetical protein [Rubinisphaera margarita]
MLPVARGMGTIMYAALGLLAGMAYERSGLHWMTLLYLGLLTGLPVMFWVASSIQQTVRGWLLTRLNQLLDELAEQRRKENGNA